MKFRPKKSLGQNFLIDQIVISKIVNSAIISKNDVIIEIGPGTGNLTEKILSKNPKELILIEKDKKLSEDLKSKFGNKVNVINKDILDIDEKFFSNQKCIVFGNLPYNISTKILTNFIRFSDIEKKFKYFILMFQKEVSDRIISKKDNREYGRLSIISTWKLQIEKIIDVNPQSFFPKPKIFSSVLKLIPKNKIYKIKNINNLERITNIFFNQRRKMIKKPLNILFKDIVSLQKNLNLDLNLRPQNLEPETYFKICEEYERLIS